MQHLVKQLLFCKFSIITIRKITRWFFSRKKTWGLLESLHYNKYYQLLNFFCNICFFLYKVYYITFVFTPFFCLLIKKTASGKKTYCQSQTILTITLLISMTFTSKQMLNYFQNHTTVSKQFCNNPDSQ